MNTKYLDNLDVIFNMTKLWEGSKDITPFSSKLWKVVKFHKLFCIKKAKENKMVKNKCEKGWKLCMKCFKMTHRIMQFKNSWIGY
jgi:coproporphyrinogen III oxidase